MTARSTVSATGLSLVFMMLASCVPWTVRPIGSEADATLTPAEYVDSVWEARLVPAVLSGAVDARTLLDALAKSPEEAMARYSRNEGGSPACFMVKGRGRVIRLDTASRSGLALIDVAPFDGRPDVSIQIGPVLRGTSLRDATGIIRFSDFVNQIQFADVGNELNDRVLKTVLGPIDKAALQAHEVVFAGTLHAEDKAVPPLRELVPVELTVEARR